MSKKTWTLIACLVLSLTLGLGGSLAYLTDSDTKVNTFTMGNVVITLNEPNGQEYDIMPGTTATDKIASIKNTGSNSAWVWMTVAVPEEIAEQISPVLVDAGDKCGQLHIRHDSDYLGLTTAPQAEEVQDGWEDTQHAQDEGGRGYRVYTYVWYDQLAPGAETYNILQGVYMDGSVSLIDGKYYAIENGNKQFLCNQEDLKVIVSAYAIQTDGIDNVYDAYRFYNRQWGDVVYEAEAETAGKTYTSSATISEYIVLDDNSENDNCVVARGADTVVTINGGKYDIGTNYNSCAVWAIGGAKVIIDGGEFWGDANFDKGHLDLIYAGSSTHGAGTIEIYNGTFGLEGSSYNNPGGWLLNENDANGEIVVYGGDFWNWNPADNVSEGQHTSFVPTEGYQVWAEYQFDGEEIIEAWYHVRPDSDDIINAWMNETIESGGNKEKVWPIEGE